MESKTLICQSCGMTTTKEARGTNPDGSKGEKYCRFCFMNGEFRDPSITKEQMTDKVADLMISKMRINKNQAQNMAKKIISNLERWQEEDETQQP